MDALRTELSTALKESMRAKDENATSTLRLIIAALKDRDIAARGKGNSDGIPEDEILQMLQSMVKQRRESIALYEQGGRLELAEKEENEIKVIKRFLPTQMSTEEMEKEINSVISELDATGLKEMGKVMAILRDRFPGRMDFGKASAIVKSILSQSN